MPDEELPLTEDDLNPADNKPLDFKLNLEPLSTTEKKLRLNRCTQPIILRASA
jgi:hypothetical protein